MANDHGETHDEEKYAEKQESGIGENRETSRKHTEESHGKEKDSHGKEKDSHGKEKVEEGSKRDREQPPPSQAPGGRTYYFTVPIRPLTAHIPDEFLERLTSYYALYGLVFGVVGAIAIVLPLVFGVGVSSLIPWLLVLGGGVTLIMFLLICGAPGTTAFLLLSALHIAAGSYLLLKPAETGKMFTFLLTGWFLLHGVLKVLMAVSVRRITTWPVVLVSGIASGVLALVVLILTPNFGVKLVSIAFGADLAFTGVSLLLISIMGFLGKSSRSVTDAELLNEPFLSQGGAGSA